MNKRKRICGLLAQFATKDWFGARATRRETLASRRSAAFDAPPSVTKAQHVAAEDGRILVRASARAALMRMLHVVRGALAAMRATRVLTLLLAVTLIAGSVAGLLLGPYPLLPFDAAAAQVLWQLRLPRVLAAAVVGAVLGVGGAVLQGWFRNPLVEPGLLGVSAGAALAAAVVLLFVPAANAWWLSACAFCGAFATVWLLARLRLRIAQDNGLVLAGIAINALVAACIGIASSIAPAERLKAFSMWGLASFDGVDLLSLVPLALAGAWMLARVLPLGTALDALSLGGVAAGHLGFDVPALERRMLFAVALGVGAATAAVGPLAFVGLLAPHLLRGLGVHAHRTLLPLAALLGAGLTVWAELGARVLFAPRELPAGVLTQIAGAVLFAQLLWAKK